MMMVEPDGVLFAGDVVQNGRIPFMNADDVDTANWLRSLAEVEKLAPKFIIPGHGRPSTDAKEAIAFTRDYITYVRAAMAKAAAGLDRFRRRLCRNRLVEIQGYAGLRRQQSRQCVPDISGDGAVAVQSR